MYRTVLPGKMKTYRFFARVACIAGWGCASFAADPPMAPLSVCEVLRDLSAQEGKDVAVLGRYSFRTSGRWVGEQACQPTLDAAPTLSLVEDKDAPKPPNNYALDGAALHRKFADMQRRTSLGKFRFGTPDYDRWAVIYGRVEKRTGTATLVFRGSGVMMFLTGEE
jgi:hypothetical protein